MVFYDCDLTYGMYVNEGPYRGCPSIEGVLKELDKAGISGGLIYNVAADVAGAATGNRLLASALESTPEGLFGIWTLLPPCTRELPSACRMPEAMRKARIAALRVNPAAHRYAFRADVLKEYLDMAHDRRIPVVFDTGCGVSVEQIDEIMHVYPALTSIVSIADVWPNGRRIYDLLERYENLHINTAFMITDQSIEDITNRFGGTRLLFGSHFPACYTGAQMLHIRHALISDTDREAIAGQNLMRLLKGADLA